MGRPRKSESNEESRSTTDLGKLLAQLPEGRDLTDAETQKILRGSRPMILRNLLTMAASDDPKQRDWATKELLAQDMGKAGTKKRTEADEVGVVLVEKGTYGT